MITGFMGIAYSTDKIGKDGRFVDKTLESDFMQARYDMLRAPNRCCFNESAWRKNTVQARQEFLKMMEDTNERNRIDFGEDDGNQETVDSESKVYNYKGGQEVDARPEKVETVIVESGVEEIADGAFKDFKNLKSVVFNEGLRKIGKNAFENCPGLANIRLNGVEYIGDEAFLNCSGLVAIELGSNIQHIGMGAFKNCTSLGAASIPPNATFVGDYVFANCPNLKTVQMVDGVVEIPAYMCQNDVELEQIILPSSIEKVGKGAFDNCPEVEVYVPTMDMDEAQELLGSKFVAKDADDDCVFKTEDGYVVRLYKDLY